jgi:hypothetical protein
MQSIPGLATHHLDQWGINEEAGTFHRLFDLVGELQ